MTIYITCNITEASEISSWLMSKGLKYPTDYDWDDFLGNPRRYWFWFKDKKWESILLLKYGN